MKTVQQGWFIFDMNGNIASTIHHREPRAWAEIEEVLSSPQADLEQMGYTCRRVRVTIEELDEKGE